MFGIHSAKAGSAIHFLKGAEAEFAPTGMEKQVRLLSQQSLASSSFSCVSLSDYTHNLAHDIYWYWDKKWLDSDQMITVP